LINAQTYTSNNNISLDANAISGMSWIMPPVFHLKMVENSGSSNSQCFLQASDDGGNTYGNMITFDDASASGNQYKSASCNNAVEQLPPFGNAFRLQHTQNTTGNWTITLKVSGMVLGGSGR
jgi:hypothetical protein